MTKKEMIIKIAEDNGITKTAAKAQLEGIMTMIKDTLVSTGKAKLPGIGGLSVVVKPACKGESFGKPFDKPEGKRVKFKVSSTLTV
jgi:nucleoid DNA-binding protein